MEDTDFVEWHLQKVTLHLNMISPFYMTELVVVYAAKLVKRNLVCPDYFRKLVSKRFSPRKELIAYGDLCWYTKTSNATAEY